MIPRFACQGPPRTPGFPSHALHTLSVTPRSLTRCYPIRNVRSSHLPLKPHLLSLAREASQVAQTADPLTSLSTQSLSHNRQHLHFKSNLELIRGWTTYRMCESEWLVQHGPSMLERLQKAFDAVPFFGPMAKIIVNAFVKHTFFRHFVGGETAKDCLPLVQDLLNRGIAPMLAYSVEGPSSCQVTKAGKLCSVSHRHIQATREAIFIASQASTTTNPNQAQVKPTTVALKISGLITDPSILERASSQLTQAGISPWQSLANEPSFPHGAILSQQESDALSNFVEVLSELCDKARNCGVRLVIDAEYFCFQPALDRLSHILASRFNTCLNSPPTVYHTFQAYLRSTPDRLTACLNSISSNSGSNFSNKFNIGIKLVRGAYLTSEIEEHRNRLPLQHHPPHQNQININETDTQAPVWSSKVETDACYDTLASQLIHQLCQDLRRNQSSHGRRSGHDVSGQQDQARISVIIAGHNSKSIRDVLKQLRDVENVAENRKESEKLAVNDDVRGWLMFAQLLAMSDNLTAALSNVLTPWHGREFDANVDMPLLIKYVPFGEVDEVMPYLGRRAQENKSILEEDTANVEGSGGKGAKFERVAIQAELEHRLKRWLSPSSSPSS